MSDSAEQVLAILEALEALRHDDDLEGAHLTADGLLCKLVVLIAKDGPHEAVAGQIVGAFEELGKWYS